MSDSFKIDLTELKKFPQKLRRAVFDDWVDKALRRYGLELEAAIVEQINDMKLNYTGTMRKSIKSIVQKYVYMWILHVGTGITSPFPYPIAVHEGSRPHWIPFGILNRWVNLKLNIQGPEGKSVTAMIQRSIAKKGTKPHPFMTVVFQREKSSMADNIMKHLFSVSQGGKFV